MPEEFLARHWTKDKLDVPPWAPMKGAEPGFSLTSGERAKQTGLAIRPIHESVRDTYEWFRTLPAERQENLRAGIKADREVFALQKWHEAQKSGS